MDETYLAAVNTIKEAILRSQSRAARNTNAEMLSLYYSIGGYISDNSRKGTWGTGAIEEISRRLREELPGLRGFSPANIKLMRQFYEEWKPYLESGLESHENWKSLVVTSELKGYEEKVITAEENSILDFQIPIEDFISISFTHHIKNNTNSKGCRRKDILYP
jgi:dynactin complex subunit